jgi:beta-glucanase (GH16 family)
MPDTTIDLTGFRQTFNDDFNSLNASPGGSANQWATTAFGIRTLPANGEQEYYSDSSVGVNPFSTGDGALTITAAPGSNPLGLPYNSGEISSQALHSQTYGYFEMRAQLPSGQGMWPAFWLMPTNGGPGEIDALEAFGASHDGQGGANSYSVALHDTSGGGQEWVDTGANTQSGYHTYGVDWEPDTITFYFDGRAVKSMATPADMHQPYYMIANLAVGGPWVGSPAGETSQMKIDYIRAYSKDPNARPATGTSSSDSSGSPGLTGSAAASGTATVGSDKLSLVLSGDLYNGSPNFIAKVDGQTVTASAMSVTAQHGSDSQTFEFNGTWGAGPHDVEIDFLNDAYNGTPDTDRNLYVEQVSYNGRDNLDHTIAMFSAGDTHVQAI